MRSRTKLSKPWVFVAIGFLAACADTPGPTQPGQGGPPSPAGTTNPTSTLLVQTLKIEGPASVPPGETAQLRATAIFSDKSSRDVTREARWSSSSETMLSVDAGGLLTGRDVGEATIETAFGGISHRTEVVVLPAGTFRLRGWVREWGVPIVGARVQVVEGPATGLATMSDLQGQYRLYGVPADVEIRVTRDGFEPYVKSVHVDEKSWTHNVELVLAGHRTDLSGNYTVTIGGGTCADARFPAALQARTYTGVLRQDDRVAVSIELRGGADFTRRLLYGHFLALEAWFTSKEFAPAYFDYDWWYSAPAVYPDIVERLPDGTLLGISGQVIIAPSPEGFSGTLDGALRIFDADFSKVLSSCESKSHRFTLTR